MKDLRERIEKLREDLLGEIGCGPNEYSLSFEVTTLIESFAREIRNGALEDAARIVVNRGCAHQDSGKANVLIEAGNAIHTLALAASTKGDTDD